MENKKDAKEAEFGRVAGELAASLGVSPYSVAGARRADLLAQLGQAHEREVRELARDVDALLGELDALTPLDAGGRPLEPGSVVLVGDEVCCVGGVDDQGGVFYVGVGEEDLHSGWRYAHGGHCTLFDLGEADPGADDATSLYELALAIRREWDGLERDGAAKRLDGLIDRLCEVAQAAAVGA